MAAKNKQRQGLLAENHHLRASLSRITEATLRITSISELSPALLEILESACGLTGARFGAVGVFDASSRIQEFLTFGISQADRARIGELPDGLGILGLLTEIQRPLRLADLTSHPRAIGFPPHHPSMRTFLGAPIRFGEECLGTIYLTEKAGGVEFTEEDENLLLLLVSHAASAIRNAQLFQREHTALVEAERANTEQRLAEEEKERERKRLQALVETSPVGIFVVDAISEKVVYVNPELERPFGLSLRLDHHLDRFQGTIVFRRPDGRQYVPEDLPLQRALREGETVRAEEVRFEFPDGRTIPTLINSAPLYTDDGQISGAIAVVQDITALEETEKLRSEFLGMVSHELRTPLSSIKGIAATVLGSRRSLGDTESRELFQIIDEQVDRLANLVNDLLDVSRIEAGALSLSPEPTDLRTALEEALAIFARRGSRETLVEVPDDLPLVKGDQRRITQVFTNLIDNAAKFSPPQTPVTVELEHDDTFVTVHVRDHGRGLSEEDLLRLFKKFSQVHEEDRQKVSGTGLGLAICKGIVEAHGGRIWADSPGEGKGATFSFTLPVAADTPALPLPAITRRADHLGRVRRTGERSRILAVDDDPHVLRYLRRLLEEAGYQAIVASEPSKVNSLVELEEPDLVLLDLMLPGSSGYELMHGIREFSGVPVIFLTGRDIVEDVVRALETGADDYITKPFSPSELVARIEAVLRRRLLSDQTETRPPFLLNDLTINFAGRQVVAHGRVVSLSASEYKLLYELVVHAGTVLTYGQLLQRVWGPEYSGETYLVRSMVRNLRRKLGDDGRYPRYILTHPGVGYRVPRP